MTDPVVDRTALGPLIDCLVDGSLEGDARRKLLSRLDAEPEGWRRCALAFLEDQCWRESLRPQAAATVRRATNSSWRSPRRARLREIAAIAVSLLTAFAAGWAVRGDRNPVSPPREFHVTAAASQSRESPAVTELPKASVPSEREGTRDAIFRDWERQGYRVEQSPRRASLALRDGRTVAVPARELRVQYVGDRVY
jgi:hypothetical protein